MLVLTRKLDESIIIGDVMVTVTYIGAGKVKLGVTAPRETPVHRGEVWKRIHEAEQEGSNRDAG